MEFDYFDEEEDETACDDQKWDKRRRRMTVEVVGLLRAIVNILDIVLDNISHRRKE